MSSQTTTHQVFAKMPQRNSVEPTSLRRSSRLLQFQDSPATPKPISRNPNSLSSFSSPSKAKNMSTNSGKSSKVVKKSDNGSRNCRKSAYGSRRTTKLSNMVDEIESRRRRSPRFCNEVNSSVDLHMSFNGNFDRYVHCNTKINRGSKKDDVKKLDFVDSPVTPILVGEKKRMGLLGKDNDNDNEASDSYGEIGRNSVRRRNIRCCSRLVGRKAEEGKIAEDEQNGNHESKTRTTRSLVVQALAARQDGEVKGKNCSKGKKNRSDSCKGLRSGSKTNCSDYLSDCVTREGHQGRQNNRVDSIEKDGKSNDSSKELVENLDRRITRRASKQLGGENDSKCQIMERRSTRNSSECVVGKVEIMKASKEKEKGSGSSKHLGAEPRKRILRSSVLSSVMKMEAKSTKDIGVKDKVSHDCVELDIDKLEKEHSDASPVHHMPARGDWRVQDLTGDTKLTGVKRKRKQLELQGWTEEQEVALQKAYFTEKPSPHFWKKVAKLVPGKSAQDCFDKVHSDNQTPLSTKPSLRATKQNSSFESTVSGSDLFKFVGKKSKKICKSKCKSRVARKTVRRLLQKYCHVNQDNEVDLFSVLEPSVNSSAEASQLNTVQLTPKHLLKSPESSSKSHDRSSSGHTKRLSKFSDSSQSLLTSPPVLKEVKNMVLHEKYIDQLHIRERKRKVAFSRFGKSVQSGSNGKENSVPMKDIIRAAKDALVSNAKDVINKFQHSQANIMDAYSDSEEFLNSDNDEDEAEL